MKRTLQPAPVITEPVASVEPARPKRSLKRTASAASLPTPPRTTHKKRRKKDDKDVDGEEEEEAEEFESSEDEKPIKPAQRAVGKGRASPSKAKVRSKVTEEEVEDAFWLGTSPKADYVELKSTTPKKTPATIVKVHARAKLPLEHPDFSPSPDVKPKRLFADEIAEEGKKPKRKRSINLPSPSPSPTRPKRKVTTIKKQRTLVTTSS
ncbi:hypothetical protein FRC17_001088 [Serendipita sp. 399]|nr:hypothetical protein FRC17_001088 [Serendipita sp. 399]